MDGAGRWRWNERVELMMVMGVDVRVLHPHRGV